MPITNKFPKSNQKTARAKTHLLPKINSNKNVNRLIFSEDEINQKHHAEILQANQNLLKNIKKNLKEMILKNVTNQRIRHPKTQTYHDHLWHLFYLQSLKVSKLTPFVQ